jgi:hypothetical protein
MENFWMMRKETVATYFKVVIFKNVPRRAQEN